MCFLSLSPSQTHTHPPPLDCRHRALLQWAESPGGKAQIAVELKALRSQASARLVRDMLATSEGKEGLIRGLQAVLASDNTLGTQLRALVGGGR